MDLRGVQLLHGVWSCPTMLLVLPVRPQQQLRWKARDKKTVATTLLNRFDGFLEFRTWRVRVRGVCLPCLWDPVISTHGSRDGNVRFSNTPSPSPSEFLNGTFCKLTLSVFLRIYFHWVHFEFDGGQYSKYVSRNIYYYKVFFIVAWV